MTGEKLVERIYNKYYGNDLALLATLRTHSECVARKAYSIVANKFPLADLDFIYEAAMLHDIGIIRCHAPSIGCHGDLPYICHGIEGRKMLEAENLPRHALVCERHTGSGLTCEEIIDSALPLPHRDMLPLSIEEKAICYADSFFSKSSDLSQEKGIETVKAQMLKFGPAVFERFMQLHSLFS